MTITETTATTPATDIPGRAAVRAGWVLSGLVVLFLLFDSAIKLLRVPRRSRAPDSSASRRARSP